MKLGETREDWALFMKPWRLEQGHFFPGIGILLCTAYKPEAKIKKIASWSSAFGSLNFCLGCSFLS
jgi:hypothetical protein